MDVPFTEAMDHASSMVDAGEITEDLLGELDLEEAITSIAALVSTELSHLTGLTDDPEQNQEAMRSLIQTAALKAFFTGMILGRSNTEPEGITVPVPADLIAALGVSMIRDGVLTLTLVSE